MGVIVNHPPSPRNVSLETAHAVREVAGDKMVLLSVNQSLAELRDLHAQLTPEIVQLHGDESPQLVEALASDGIRVWKAIHGDAPALMSSARGFRDAGAEAVLVDARESKPGGTIYGGTGKIADWNGARALVDAGFRVVLAGGLSPDNVAHAVQIVKPFAVDCISGVEASKGTKDESKVRAFVRAARSTSKNAL